MPRPRPRSQSRYRSAKSLEQAILEARAERDPRRSLESLRGLYPHFAKIRGAARHWPLFVAGVLYHNALLKPADHDRLRDEGGRLVALGRMDITRAWWPIIDISLRSGRTADAERAWDLLVRLYNHPAAGDGARVSAAARLAYDRVTGDRQLAVYADVMARRIPAPPHVAMLVPSILAVGFDSEATRLRTASVLAADWTRVLGRTLPELEYVLGLGELLLDHRPSAAISHFRRALVGSVALAGEAQRGLLAAMLQDGEFRAAASMKSQLLNPRARQLLLVCRMLAWLDGPGAPENEAAPASAAQLAAIAPGPDLGSWRDYALGRTYLIEGDAERARKLLAPLKVVGLPETELAYHAAWAALLSRERGSAESLLRAAASSGSWALSCLLHDLADGVPLPEAVSQPLRGVAAVRKAMAAGEATEDLRGGVDWDALEQRVARSDLLEAFRTSLGAALADRPALAKLTRDPLFARLPAAERALWNGLSAEHRSRAAGAELLEEARMLGSDRAAALLALKALDEGRSGDVGALLQGVPGRQAEMVKAWAEHRNGRESAARQRFAELSARGAGRADYIMGLLELRDAVSAWALSEPAPGDTTGGAQGRAERAAAHFTSAAARGCRTRASTALGSAAQELARNTYARTLPWYDFTAQPWVARHFARAALVRSPQLADRALLGFLADVDDLESRPDTRIEESAGAYPAAQLAAVLERACVLAGDGPAAEVASAVLTRLAARYPLPEVTRAARMAAIYFVQDSNADFSSHSTEPHIALRHASSALHDGDVAAAVEILRTPRRADESAPSRGHDAIALFADVLGGKPVPDPLPFSAPANVAAAYRVAAAARLAGSGKKPESARQLYQAFREHDIRFLLKPGPALAALCARHCTAVDPARAAEDWATLITTFAAAHSENDPQGRITRSLAHCAALIGEQRTAVDLWTDAVDRARSDPKLTDELRREYAHYLCHLAAKAGTSDPAETIRLLRTAAEFSSRVSEHVAFNEQKLLIQNFLRYLFPGSPMLKFQRTGRYQQLAVEIRTHPSLKTALDLGSPSLTLKSWLNTARMPNARTELLHTAAVLCREDALTGESGTADTARRTTAAAALWSLLLSDASFPDLYADRGTADTDEASFRSTMIGERLSACITGGSRALAAGDRHAAREYVRCLTAVGDGIEATRLLLANGPWEPVAAAAGEIRAFATAETCARDLLDDWCLERINAAQIILEDPTAIAANTEDFRENYRPAIAELDRVLELGVRRKNILITRMQWYNRMFSDFFKRRDFTAMGKVLKDAESFADRLIEQCTPGLSHLDENTAIAAYYCYRGLHAEQMLTTERTLREFEKSLAWDPQDTVYITNLAVTLTNHADEIVNAARKAQATSPASKTLTSALASAISHLNEALEHSPSYDTALTKLAKFQAEYERITNP